MKEQLDLETCINTLKMLQITHTYAQEINTDVTTHTVKYKSAPNKSTTNNPRRVQSTKHKRHSLSQHGDDRSLCTSCGGSHPVGNCPAHGAICRDCGRVNHYAAQCPERAATCRACKNTVQTSAQRVVPSVGFAGREITMRRCAETSQRITWLTKP